MLATCEDLILMRRALMRGRDRAVCGCDARGTYGIRRMPSSLISLVLLDFGAGFGGDFTEALWC